MFVNKTILLISPEPWNHIFVSKHHYAVHLARKGNRVFFLNPPASSESISKTNFNNVFSVNYSGLPKGLRFYPSSIQKHFLKRKFFQLQKLCGVKFDIIWSFDNSVFFDFTALPSNLLKISHIVDLNQDFQFAKAAVTADLCFSPNHFILDKQREHNSNSYFINHGCYIDPDEHTGVFSLPGINSVKACYAGNLDIEYFDWRLFETVISENTNVDFILAGPWSDKLLNEKLIGKPNLFHIGNLYASQLQSFYSAGNLLFILYDADRYKEQLANPHKMMGYLASGNVVVATYTAEYEDLSNQKLIVMSSRNEEYPALFKQTIKAVNEWNSMEKQSIRKLYAKENSYESQIERIEIYSNTTLSRKSVLI